ncbi:MAG: ABC transporter ATP-binding protein [Verrucomicrobia bacterium]|nr:ABC transporter ATP-binding protein [Verrucomicrobiota bacterium]
MLMVGLIPVTVAIVGDPSRLQRIPFMGSSPALSGDISELRLLLYATLLIFLIGCLKITYFFVSNCFIINSCRAIRVRLSTKLLESYMSAPWAFHVNASKPELLRNVASDTREIVIGVIQPLINASHGLIFSILILIAMTVALPYKVIVIFIMTAVAVVGALNILSGYLRGQGEKAKYQYKQVIRDIQEALGNFVEAQVYGRKGWFVERFSKRVFGFALAQDKMQLVSRMIPDVMELVSLMSVLTLIIILTRTTGDIVSVLPEITLIAVGAVRLRQATTLLTSAIAQIQFSSPSLDHIYDDFERLPSRSIKASPSMERIPFRESIKISDVSFDYPESETPALRNVNLNIRKGQSIAFIGETGCGKSTLLRILLGLHLPTSGKVLVDGADIHENLQGWRANIGYVPQTVFLLDGSISDNIAFGIETEEIDLESLKRSIETANLSELIDSLPDGIDTKLGDNGSKLSGGQCQRIGIARAVYFKPDVLVLDEATSALDHHTELRVLSGLESLSWRPTIIFVTHRVKAVEAFDEVIEMQASNVPSEAGP